MGSFYLLVELDHMCTQPAKQAWLQCLIQFQVCFFLLNALHYADLGDIQQNIFSFIIKIIFCYGFSTKFQECLLGVKEKYRKNLPNCTFCYENWIFFLILDSVSGRLLLIQCIAMFRNLDVTQIPRRHDDNVFSFQTKGLKKN